MLAAIEVQEWLYDALTGGSIGASVLDKVSDNAQFPYVTIGETINSPFRTHDRDGESMLQRIHVWSRAKGFKEALQIAENINELLNAQAVATTAFHGFALRERSQSFRDPDGITRHLVLEYRIFAHATA